MSYIKLAIVDDNIDPKGIGRIRFKVMGESSSARENAIKYESWDSNDPFVANPFLPTNINYIPEIGQTVKILTYDPDNDYNNREYIAGPFTTIHDWNSQTNSRQLENTSYGIVVQKSKDIFNKSIGTYVKKESEGSLPNFKDYAIHGPYGSDILFTENGVNLRGGKYVVKDTPKKVDVENFPIMSEKRSLLSLKKFSTKKENKIVETEIEVLPNKKLQYVVEYNVDDLENPTLISWYVYEVKNVYGDTFNTAVFTANSVQDLGSINGIKLINLKGDQSPTYTQTVTSYKDAYIKIRRGIDDLNLKGLREFDRRLDDLFLYPFFYRPVRTLTNTEFLKKILPTTNVESTNGCGLYFSPSENSPRPKKEKKKENKLVDVAKNVEQTFGSLTSDKIYLLSTDTNSVSDKKIPFDKLNKYEYNHEDLLTLIEPNTYSVVRGELLIRALKLMYNVLLVHAHNPGKPMPDGTPHRRELEEIFKTLENDILNKSIRIN